jgi:hypothetical protein
MKLNLDLVAKTWAELGCRVRPTRRMVFVRTEVFNNKNPGGLLWLPGKLHGFHGGLPHMRTVYAIVISAGPEALVKEGERVAFMRLHFAVWKPLAEEGAFAGWIDQNDLIGYADYDVLADEAPEIVNAKQPEKRDNGTARRSRSVS